MRGHIRRRGSGWAFVIDVDGGWPARRCGSCGRRHWVESQQRSKACIDCGAQLGAQVHERRQVWSSGYRTRRLAEDAMRDRLRALDEDSDPFPTDITVGQFAPTFLERKAGTVRPYTLSRYRSILDRDVVPAIGHVELRKVKPAHLQLVLDAVAITRGRRCVEEAKAVMSGLLRTAASGGLVDSNAARGGTLEIRDGAKRRKDLVPLEADHVRALLQAAAGTTWHVPMNLVVRLGLRRSEVLGLRWDDIDLDAATITISRSLHRVRDEAGSRLVCLEPKSKTSARTITIGEPVARLLRDHRRAQRERRLFAGPAWRDEGFVSDNGLGGPLDPDSMSTAFKRFAAALELPQGVRLHDLRHAAARLALEAGAPLESVSRMLGHSTLSFTHKQYVAPTANQTTAAVSALERLYATD